MGDTCRLRVYTAPISPSPFTSLAWHPGCSGWRAMKELDVSLRDLAFPFPEPDARAQLWQRLIPQEAPVAPDLDLDELARRFELSGGFIRNIVLRGAFLPERAARGEYGDRGVLGVGGRLV